MASQINETTADVETAPAPPLWLEGFKEDFQALLVTRWSPYIGALILVAISLGLMMNGLFWGVFGGLKLWGDWIFSLVGLGSVLGISDDLASPIMHRISLMNITVIIGAFSAAMIAGDFKIAKARKIDYTWGALGGTFMGVGACLAGGCTIGGFFTPTLFGSASSWVTLAGFMIGAIIGLKALFWTMGTIKWGTKPPAQSKSAPISKTHGPLIGLLVMAAIVAWAVVWLLSDDEKLGSRGLVIMAGFALGFVLHRSRFCFSRAIREPFMTGDGTMTKALIASLLVGIPLAYFMLQNEIIDPFVALPPRFWMGSLSGGVLFGFGMIFASGCASGSLWRAGEGQVKLWIAVLFFALSGSLFNVIVKPIGLLSPEMTLDLVEATPLGQQAYLPDMLGGWTGTYVLVIGLLALWYLFVRYNESTEKFTVL